MKYTKQLRRQGPHFKSMIPIIRGLIMGKNDDNLGIEFLMDSHIDYAGGLVML